MRCREAVSKSVAFHGPRTDALQVNWRPSNSWSGQPPLPTRKHAVRTKIILPSLIGAALLAAVLVLVVRIARTDPPAQTDAALEARLARLEKRLGSGVQRSSAERPKAGSSADRAPDDREDESGEDADGDADE